jgi:large subunit ribosomal protein L18
VSTQSRLAVRRQNRAFRVRKAGRGSAERPRITVHRTHLHVYAQMIDDVAGRTLCEASSASLKLKYGGNVAAAKAVGEALAQKAKALGIQAAAFDRGSYRYHGRVKALADAVRAGGVKF